MLGCAYVPPASVSTGVGAGGGAGTTRAVCEKRTVAVVGIAAALALAALPMAAPRAPAHAEIVNRGICVSGEGPGCADATEDNPLIKQLQEKSRVNREKNEQEAKDKYWLEGYGSYFKFQTGKQLVKNPETGKWSLEKPDDSLSKAIQRAGIIPDFDR